MDLIDNLSTVPREVRGGVMRLPGKRCFRQRNSRCKGPVAGVCLECPRSRNQRERREDTPGRVL